MAANNTTTVNIRNLMDHHKLVGNNFLSWRRNLKLVLRAEKLEFTLDQAPPTIRANASAEARTAYEVAKDPFDKAYCIMMSSMNDELQKQCENTSPQQIMNHLVTLYQGQAREERYNVAKELFHMRMSEKDSVSSHGVKFLGLLKRLNDLGLELQNDLAVDLLLSSLPSSWASFVMNFNMNGGPSTPA